MVTIMRRPNLLSAEDAIAQVRRMVDIRLGELEQLDKIHSYVRGEQKIPGISSAVPPEVISLLKVSRVNVLDLILSSVAQSLYIDGFRQDGQAEDAPPWSSWQANKMDARQIAVHRSALAYGASYVSVLPGDVAPVIRGHSPRLMTTLYGEDDWPMWALQTVPMPTGYQYRLYDQRAVYVIDAPDASSMQFLKADLHGADVVPIIRFVNKMDLDDELVGEIVPLMPIQDQIDITTFELMVAQHFGAYRQRWIIGWTAPDEDARLKASASRLWTFEDSPEDVKVGEFNQTDLKGYLESRESSLRHAATISQTPAHELIGQMVNLSAEALVAAEASQRRKITERQMSFGESWEQVLALAGNLGGFEVQEGAQVRWRDTESRALSATVDALGKMSQMLGVPPQELWEKLPGVTQQDVERWKATAASNDALGNLTRVLEQQAAGVDANAA